MSGELKKRVCLLFGGKSTEHEVSAMSATFVAESILALPEWELSLIAITKSGRFLAYSGSLARLADGSWQEDKEHLQPVVFSAGEGRQGYGILAADGSLNFCPVDCYFPVLHGKNGEDGTIQGLFRMLGTPFVGCDVLASAVLMDKAIMRQLFHLAGLSQPRWKELRLFDYRKEGLGMVEKLIDGFAYPFFIKPANSGSSVGVSKVSGRGGLEAALETAFAHDNKLLVEEGVLGREIECSILEGIQPGGELFVSAAGEIIPDRDFYDYEAKYHDDRSRLLIPAPLDKEQLGRIQEMAKTAFRAANGRGIARADFYIRRDGSEILINELNTMPGFTRISMYPKLLQFSGISVPDMMRRFVGNALAAET